MNPEKKEKLRVRTQGRKVGNIIRTMNIVNIVVLGVGFICYWSDMHPTLTKIGIVLFIAAAISVFATLLYQIYMTAKMRKESKKGNT